MPADFDASEFVDGDFQFHKTAYSGLASVQSPSPRADFDASEFVDGDFQFHKTAYSGLASVQSPSPRAPMREEENARALAIQQELAELKRRQEEKEREKAAVE